MSSWNYRIVRTIEDGEELFGVYEVYYNDEGIPWARTERPVGFISETRDGLYRDLRAAQMALIMDDSAIVGEPPD